MRIVPLVIILLFLGSYISPIRPMNNPWIGTISEEFDTGYCGYPVSGYGWTGNLSYPTFNHTVESDRYFRINHSGLDFTVDSGTPVYASENGIVIWTGFSKWGSGNLVVLAHGDGWRTYYAHLDSAVIECNTFVNKGDLVGYSGQTGMASWPHLHFEIRRVESGKATEFSYDPMEFLSE